MVVTRLAAVTVMMAVLVLLMSLAHVVFELIISISPNREAVSGVMT